MQKVAIFGSGSWGITLANLLNEKGIKVNLWVHDGEVERNLILKKRDPKLPPEISLQEGVEVSGDMAKCSQAAEGIIIAVASKFIGQFSKKLAPLLNIKQYHLL